MALRNLSCSQQPVAGVSCVAPQLDYARHTNDADLSSTWIRPIRFHNRVEFLWPTVPKRGTFSNSRAPIQPTTHPTDSNSTPATLICALPAPKPHLGNAEWASRQHISPYQPNHCPSKTAITPLTFHPHDTPYQPTPGFSTGLPSQDPVSP